MLPAADTMKRFVAEIEQNVHRKGWDHPPTLLVLRWQPPTMVGKTMPFDLRSPVGGFLTYVARNLAENREYADVFAASALARPGFAGFALVSEAWTHPSMTMAELAATGRDLPDIPGSIELRTLVAVDIEGRIHQVYRERGRAPITEGWSSIGGLVVQALLDMTIVVCQQMPDAEANLHLLAAVELDDPTQVEARR
jgi:hypothetical protein